MSRVMGDGEEKVDVKQLRFLTRKRLFKIEKEIGELEAEKSMLETIIKEFMDPCPNCNGLGEVNALIGQYSTRSDVCTACNGTGNRKK